jgi:protein phosphatase
VLELAILKLSERKNLNPVPFLKEAVSLASIRVYEKALMDEKLEGMGTTLVAIYATDSKIYIIQVGDSRVYLVRDTGMWQVTEDHSLVNEQLRTGLITKEQAEKSNYKNVITRSVGFEEIVEPEIYSREIQKGDLFLLCSDGLTSMLTNDEIYNNIDPGNLEKSIDKLISSSNKAGGLDNVSVVFVKVN